MPRLVFSRSSLRERVVRGKLHEPWRERFFAWSCRLEPPAGGIPVRPRYERRKCPSAYPPRLLYARHRGNRGRPAAVRPVARLVDDRARSGTRPPGFVVGVGWRARRGSSLLDDQASSRTWPSIRRSAAAGIGRALEPRARPGVEDTPAVRHEVGCLGRGQGQVQRAVVRRVQVCELATLRHEVGLVRAGTAR